MVLIVLALQKISPDGRNDKIVHSNRFARGFSF